MRRESIIFIFSTAIAASGLDDFSSSKFSSLQMGSNDEPSSQFRRVAEDADGFNIGSDEEVAHLNRRRPHQTGLHIEISEEIAADEDEVGLIAAVMPSSADEMSYIQEGVKDDSYSLLKKNIEEDPPSYSSFDCPDPWIPGEKYDKKDLALFPDQIIYECRKKKCKDKGWDPIGPCVSTPTPDPTQYPTQSPIDDIISSSDCPDPWIPGEKYDKEDLALFPDQIIYECRKKKCKDKGWDPIGPCLSTPTPDPTHSPSGECPNSWNPTFSFLYEEEDEVTFDGVLYFCRDEKKCRNASNQPGDLSNEDSVEAWLPLGPCPHVVADCPDLWALGYEYDEGDAVRFKGQLYVCLDDKKCKNTVPGSDSSSTSAKSKKKEISKDVWRLVGPCLTSAPTDVPSLIPSWEPSISPSGMPSVSLLPSKSPTGNPTQSPTGSPTASPTDSPTSSPTKYPTISPTSTPTDSPTASPTSSPTTLPSLLPSEYPSNSASPSFFPTTSYPTFSPTISPSRNPTANPTVSPTGSPTTSPFSAPSGLPSTVPFAAPSESPTFPFPTFSPTVSPTSNPAASPM